MNDTICINENYSTTRLVTKEKPELVHNPEDKFETLLFLPPKDDRKGEGGLRTNGYFKKSYEGKPLISVITVVYNGEKYLEQTIESVIKQTYDNVEYIIIDGGSTDGTLDIIKKYEDKIDYWVSEKDEGIYDAMNKGIKYSKGQWIYFIGSDDELYDINVLLKISKYLKNRYDIVYGKVELINNEEDSCIKKQMPKRINKFTMYKNLAIWHQSIFTKIDLLKNGFDPNFSICADMKWFYSLLNGNYKFKFIDFIIARYNIKGRSYESKIRQKEILEIIKLYYNPFLMYLRKYFWKIKKIF